MSEAHVNPQRLRTLYVMRILLEYSDENHLLSSSDIVRRLREYGVNAERKSIEAIRNGDHDGAQCRLLCKSQDF